MNVHRKSRTTPKKCEAIHASQAHMTVDEACQRIAKVPGIGLLTATALVATMGDLKHFKSGREFTAWLELVPPTNEHGRTDAFARGDAYSRTLLIQGARVRHDS